MTHNRLAMIAVAFALIVVTLERFPGERWWPSYLLVYSPQMLWMMPLIIVALYFLRHRRWIHSGGMFGLVGIMLVLLVGTPLPHRHISERYDLRVLTWNLHYGLAGPEVPVLAQSLLPDIICLQEADPWAVRELDKTLKMPQFRGWQSQSCGELVILSRFPMKWLDTTHSALWVEADANGSKLTIIDAHFSRPIALRGFGREGLGWLSRADDFRMMQLRRMMAKLPRDRPVILCGDLNTPPNSRMYRELESRLTDSFSASGQGLGLSFMRSIPMVRIDHIFLGEGLAPVRCWTPASSGSNHKPVIADIRIVQD
jgi:vancomycin resistance protein VanJ